MFLFSTYNHTFACAAPLFCLALSFSIIYHSQHYHTHKNTETLQQEEAQTHTPTDNLINSPFSYTMCLIFNFEFPQMGPTGVAQNQEMIQLHNKLKNAGKNATRQRGAEREGDVTGRQAV